MEQLLNPNKLMLKFEIKKASNCINIYDPLHAFLRFSWNTEEKRLSLELTSALFVFTKVWNV